VQSVALDRVRVSGTRPADSEFEPTIRYGGRRMFRSIQPCLSLRFLILPAQSCRKTGRASPRIELVGTDAFAGALTRGSIGTIPETAETENTRSYQGGVWLPREDSNS
jgi:hypothetical protein